MRGGVVRLVGRHARPAGVEQRLQVTKLATGIRPWLRSTRRAAGGRTSRIASSVSADFAFSLYRQRTRHDQPLARRVRVKPLRKPRIQERPQVIRVQSRQRSRR
jgi:hypothetical protein